MNILVNISFNWLISIIVLLGASGLCHAATIKVPSDYSTIQAGIEAASNGDTVLVASGIYVGSGNINLDFVGKAITVKSVNGAASTVIDCQGAGRGFFFHSAEGLDSRLIGFTIKNGYVDGSSLHGGKGGGIHCSSASPTISHCVISNCTASGFGGGGIILYKSSAKIENTIIEENTTEVAGGGLLIVGGAPVIYNSIIQRNKTTGVSSGGGICVFGANATISHCTISYNDSNTSYIPSGGEATNSGGISFRDGSTGLLESSIISYNKAQERGGIGSWDASPTVLNCLVEHNEATLYGGGGIGLHYNANAMISRSIIKNNVAEEYGAGISVWNEVASVSGPSFSDCIIEDNKVTGPTGGAGGLNAYNASLKISRCIFRNNIASTRAGVSLNGSGATTLSLLVNNLIYNNVATRFGGGITCFNGADATITNCTVVNNTSGSGSAGLHVSNSNARVANSIFWGNSNDDLIHATSITYSDIRGGYTGIGNLNADPVFTSASDFHLLESSPCIDTGNNGAEHAPSDDLGLNPRDGSIDMGTYEFPYITGEPGTTGIIGANIPVVPEPPDPDDMRLSPGLLFLLLR